MIPKLNDTPKYDIVIPSSGRKVRFRPYLVREEKVLLFAFESNDKRTGLSAVVDTITSCIVDKIDPRDLTLYDVEYLFGKIRAKSAGEVASVKCKCKKCQHLTPVDVDIDAVIMETFEGPTRFKMEENIDVEMRSPSYLDILNSELVLNANTQAEKLIGTVTESIKAIYTDTARIDVKDEPREELIEFVDSLDENQFKILADFVKSGPKLKYVFDFVCEKCFDKNHVEVKETENFF